MNKNLELTASAVAKAWTQGDYDDVTKAKVSEWLENAPDEILKRFQSPLAFGTGGIRALVGIGTSYLNKYTVRQIAQGLANAYSNHKQPKKICIAYDGREHSKSFAKEVSSVLLANGWEVYLSSSERPTPFLSFQCKNLSCLIGIMITASHNPKEYNGIKVYNSNGGQLVSPEDKYVISHIDKVNHLDRIGIVVDVDRDPNLHLLSEKEDDDYLRAIESSLRPFNTHKNNISVVYSNLNGCGITLMKAHLSQLGIQSIQTVKDQEAIDPHFSGAKSSNPEDLIALEKGINQLISTNADIFIANDPDADRISLVINDNGSPWVLTGHEIAILLLDFILSNDSNKTFLPDNPSVIKSVVTSELLRSIAKEHGCNCLDVLPGFKYIAEWINQDPSNTENFLLGAEESYGYMFRPITNDKDGIAIGGLICLMTAYAKNNAISLRQQLFELYKKHGIYREKLVSVSGDSSQSNAIEIFQKKLDCIRENIPRLVRVQDEPMHVYRFTDFLGQKVYDFSNDSIEESVFPPSNIIKMEFDNGLTLFLRPSGTEPKIKLYGHAIDRQSLIIEDGIDRCDEKLAMLLQAYQMHFSEPEIASKNRDKPI